MVLWTEDNDLQANGMKLGPSRRIFAEHKLYAVGKTPLLNERIVSFPQVPQNDLACPSYNVYKVYSSQRNIQYRKDIVNSTLNGVAQWLCCRIWPHIHQRLAMT